jgi:signal transduction histidine kinase
VASVAGGGSIALLAGTLVLLFLDRNAVVPPEALSWSLSSVVDILVNTGVPVIGIVLVVRRPENLIGRLFLLAGLALAIQNFASAYAVYALRADPGSLPAGRALAWVSNVIWPIPVGTLPFLFLLFPTGRLRSRRWLPVGWLTGALVAVLVFCAVVFATSNWRHPFASQFEESSGGVVEGVVGVLFVIALYAVPVAMVASVVSAAVRYVRSEGDERLQLKWFATAAALVAMSFTVAVVWDSSIASVVTTFALLFLYVAIGLAVLKYRLYEIDVVIAKTVVYATLGAFITLVYVGIVAGVGTLVGSSRNPLLSALAAGVVAVAFQPARQRARHLANRLVYGKRATPYEVLSDFSARAADTYSTEDVLPRMVQILAAGIGATEAGVWLRVGAELRPAATWPANGVLAPVAMMDDDLPAFAEHEHAFPVRHGGELLGAITVVTSPGEPLSSEQERLLRDVAAQTALVLRNVRLIEELRESRRRIVTAQDERAKALERNLHDGAQQQLVALSVKQRLAENLVGSDPEKARLMLAEIQTDTQAALENLRDLARGIYPPLLADQGLRAALTAQARKAAVPVEVRGDSEARYAQEIEAAVYFCCLEALQNVAKYANAHGATIRLSVDGGWLRFEVEDDGSGFDPNATRFGTGLQGMADRLEAVGGSLKVRSETGRGTTVVGRVPAAGGHLGRRDDQVDTE